MANVTINARALSEDGYIINQRLLKNLSYGMKQSSYNGCGWIAAYNFLHACGRRKDWNTVRQQMEDGLLFGGLLGTHIVQLYLYLRRHGFPLRWAFGEKGAMADAQRCRAGILFYFNGAALHFVTFVPAPEQRLEPMEAMEQIESMEQTQQTEQTEPMDNDDESGEASVWYRFFNARMGKQEDYATMEAFLQREAQLPVLVQLTTKLI